MYFIEIALFAIAVTVLFIGYRKNNRNLLLSAAVLMLVAGSFGSVVSGFIEGYQSVVG